MKTPGIVALLAAAVWVAACSSSEKPDDSYHVVLRNEGRSSIENASVRYGDYTADSGHLAPGGEYRDRVSREKNPVPAEAVVEWLSGATGLPLRKEVPVIEHLPKPFNGKLMFVFKGDKLEFRWKE